LKNEIAKLLVLQTQRYVFILIYLDIKVFRFLALLKFWGQLLGQMRLFPKIGS